MIPDSIIAKLEAKDLETLTEEEAIMWQYWHSYKEANLWYNLITNDQLNDSCMSRVFSYAKKGKDSALKALTLQSKLTFMIANKAQRDIDFNLEDDAKLLKTTVELATTTMQYSNASNIVPQALIDEIKQKKEQAALSVVKQTPNKIDNVKEVLASRGLAIAEGAGEITKINMNLKILDNLFFSGKISEKVYNSKCRQMMEKKAKLAA